MAWLCIYNALDEQVRAYCVGYDLQPEAAPRSRTPTFRHESVKATSFLNLPRGVPVVKEPR